VGTTNGISLGDEKDGKGKHQGCEVALVVRQQREEGQGNAAQGGEIKHCNGMFSWTLYALRVLFPTQGTLVPPSCKIIGLGINQRLAGTTRDSRGVRGANTAVVTKGIVTNITLFMGQEIP